jgi:competence protein ComEC
MTPLVVFTLAWIGGMLLIQAHLFPLVWLLLALPLTMVLLVGWGDEPAARRAALVLVGLLLGGGRMALAQPHLSPDHIAYYRDADAVTVEGVAVAEPDRRATHTNLRLKVTRLVLPDGRTPSVRGLLLVNAPPYAPVHYGDRVRATGTLVEPPVFAAFSYREYLARRGIHALLRRAQVEVLAQHQANPLLEMLFRFKAHALGTLHALLPEPHSSLLAGILLGVESGIPERLNEAFAATGTSHIVAISGFNLTLIAGTLAAATRRAFERRGEVLLPLAGLWVYTVLVGASAAVLRAAVMASVTIVARGEDRSTHGPTSLAAAVWVMSLLNPHVLWDLGFQLSFAATAGLLLYTEPLTRWFLRQLSHVTSAERAERVVGWLSDALIVTLAAQITTTPLIVGTFHQLSLVTLLTNLLILPAQPYVMLFGGVALLGGLVLRPLGQALAWVAWAFLAYTIEVVMATAALPWASLDLGAVARPLIWGYYLALGLATWWWAQPREGRRRALTSLRRLAQWQVAGALAMLALLFLYLASAPDGRLHVRFMDVGAGDAIFVRTPDGKQVLIDGGADAPATLSEVGRAMPFWDRRLDMVILTSPDADRLAGLVPVLERYTVDFVALGAELGQGSVHARWRELLDARTPESVGALWAGLAWDLDRDVTLEALWPDPGVAGPLVLRLRHGDVSFLLSGDATTLVEEALVAREGHELKCTVLHLARHGAATSSTPAYLEATAPAFAVVSPGAPPRPPAPVVLARTMDTPLHRVDRDGTVEFVSDGRDVHIRTP